MGRQQTLGLSSLEKIAAYFKVSVDTLTGKENTPETATASGVSNEVMELAQLIESLTDDQRQMLRVQVQALAQSQTVPGVASNPSHSAKNTKAPPETSRGVFMRVWACFWGYGEHLAVSRFLMFRNFQVVSGHFRPFQVLSKYTGKT